MHVCLGGGVAVGLGVQRRVILEDGWVCLGRGRGRGKAGDCGFKGEWKEGCYRVKNHTQETLGLAEQPYAP